MPFTGAHEGDFSSLPKREPVATAGVVTAGIALLVAFGLPISEEQTGAIVTFVAIAGPLVAALFARRKVTPVAGGRHRAEG